MDIGLCLAALVLKQTDCTELNVWTHFCVFMCNYHLCRTQFAVYSYMDLTALKHLHFVLISEMERSHRHICLLFPGIEIHRNVNYKIQTLADLVPSDVDSMVITLKT